MTQVPDDDLATPEFVDKHVTPAAEEAMQSAMNKLIFSALEAHDAFYRAGYEDGFQDGMDQGLQEGAES